MSLAPGVRLGAYEILSLLGAGGMGEVYRARDTRLGRDVAIKILPSQLAADPELRARFAREAHTISTLEHPNICAVYDVGEHDSVAFLVMQHLEGETLEQRLKKGALPIDEALHIAIPIADALDKAHRRGIIHRDVKPGNIMITKSGAKLLDFGLAKIQAAPAAGSLSMLPTTPPNLTAQGSLLGTFQYMAPEQLEGQEADARTDIFAFGAVLYEMIAGRRAFEGKSQASLISSIMTGTPGPLSAQQPLTPPALERVVRKCLAKDPDARWQNASDLEDELKWILEGSVAAAAQAARGSGARRTARAGWAVAAMLGAALVVVAGLWVVERRQSAPSTGGAIRFAATLPDGWAIAPVHSAGASTAPLAISPDGRRLAIVAIGPQKQTQIWIRPIDALSAAPLSGTEGAASPFWSPDSRFLAFFADGHLKKIDAAGGPPITLCDAPRQMGGTWGTGGVILFTAAASSPISKVSEAGGVPAPATRFAEGEGQHWRPSFLPDGRHFIYRSDKAGDRGSFYVASLDSPDTKLVLQADSSNAIYSQGHLLFLLGSTLMAQPFDLARLELSGEPIPVAQRVEVQSSVPNGLFTASDNGVLVYQTGDAVAATELVWLDRSGKELSKLGEPAAYQDVELSPDGTRLAVGVLDVNIRRTDLWIYDVARNLRTRFTSDPGREIGARWTADGKNIAYLVDGKGIFLKPSSGSVPERRLIEAPHGEYPDSWSRDQRLLLYELNDPNTSWDIWVLPVAGGARPYPFVQKPLRQEYARFSPDGRWVAYQSTESGREEIYVAPFPGPGDTVHLSTRSGRFPRWRRDGNEIFYIGAANTVIAVPVDGSGAAFKPGVEVPLFEAVTERGDWAYDVLPDGSRFLINRPVVETSTEPITVVVNWADPIRKK
jgi:Tol biopolymer transport system component/Ser/Thr protein kinase RdoA (MazF antagonist)